jgi:HEAT repeat protein
MLTAALTLSAPGVATAQAPAPVDARTESTRVAALRQAGLSGDRSRIPELITALRDTRSRRYSVAAMHALARLGAQEAIPVLGGLIEASSPPISKDYIRMLRARLVAETSTSGQRRGSG